MHLTTPNLPDTAIVNSTTLCATTKSDKAKYKTKVLLIVGDRVIGITVGGISEHLMTIKVHVSLSKLEPQ